DGLVGDLLDLLDDAGGDFLELGVHHEHRVGTHIEADVSTPSVQGVDATRERLQLEDVGGGAIVMGLGGAEPRSGGQEQAKQKNAVSHGLSRKRKVVPLESERGGSRFELVLNLAEDLLEDVLHGQDADGRALLL